MVVIVGKGVEHIVITGGSGLVGRAIHDVVSNNEKYLNNYTFHFLSSSDCDLTSSDLSAWQNILKQTKPNAVIHLAAFVGGLYRNMKSNYTFLQKNLQINSNVINECVELKIPRFVGCLSTCIFPDGIELPLTVERLHDGPPHQSNYGYSYAKRILSMQCLAARQQFGLDYVCVVPTNVFGPYDNFNENDGHVIAGLIHRCHFSENEFIVWGSGKPQRQFIYSKDLARLILWTLKHYNEPEPLILAPDDEYSIREIAEKILKSTKSNKVLKFDSSKADGQYKKTASNAKLKELYPDFKFTNIDDALKETCDWFEQNKQHARIW